MNDLNCESSITNFKNKNEFTVSVPIVLCPSSTHRRLTAMTSALTFSRCRRNNNVWKTNINQQQWTSDINQRRHAKSLIEEPRRPDHRPLLVKMSDCVSKCQVMPPRLLVALCLVVASTAFQLNQSSSMWRTAVSRHNIKVTTYATSSQLYYSLVGNAYLNSLEQQTMAAAAWNDETLQDVVVMVDDQDKDVNADNSNETEESLMQKIKQAGTAGIISFAMVQLGFWSASFALALGAYVKMTGHWPDVTDQEEMSTLAAGTCQLTFV